MGIGQIRVVVVGAAGKMGREALRTLIADPQFEIVAGVVRVAGGRRMSDLVSGAPDRPLDEDLAQALNREPADVVLDLSLAEASPAVARTALAEGIPFVSGVSGLTSEDVEEIRRLSEAHRTPALIIPNFAIGAVLAMRFAELAARWMPDVEIIELHHPGKADAPSGTAMMTARRVSAARIGAPTTPRTALLRAEGARGAQVDEVPVHSVRLPGLLAHQEVLFGAPGELLTIRHDVTDRSVYMAGIKLCLTRVRGRSGLTVGMDGLLE